MSCCAAEAMQRIRQGEIGGVAAGISMPDHIIMEENPIKLLSGNEIGFAHMRGVKVHHYVLPWNRTSVRGGNPAGIPETSNTRWMRW